MLAELRADFPDVSASKIRFLEAEGLITPQRTASGYRTFSDADVQRLGYILSAQRDRFWPLKVIGEALDALDRGLTDPGDGAETARQMAPQTADDGVEGGTPSDARAGGNPDRPAAPPLPPRRRATATTTPRWHGPGGHALPHPAPTPRCRPRRTCSSGIPSR